MRVKLRRPYIPWSVREQVIDGQMAAAKFTPTWTANHLRSTEQRVRWKLEEFFGCLPVELHHRPALLNRQMTRERYVPDANDPDYLVYLPANEHDIETRVRGLHGQHSDLALARIRKRKEKKPKRPRFRWRKKRR